MRIDSLERGYFLPLHCGSKFSILADLVLKSLIYASWITHCKEALTGYLKAQPQKEQKNLLLSWGQQDALHATVPPSLISRCSRRQRRNWGGMLHFFQTLGVVCEWGGIIDWHRRLGVLCCWQFVANRVFYAQMSAQELPDLSLQREGPLLGAALIDFLYRGKMVNLLPPS